MDVIISGRHVEVDDSIKAHAEERMLRLSKEYPKLTSARVVIDHERSWQVVEVHVNGKHLTLDAKATTRDVLISIDAAADKLEKQLRKHLERMQEHRTDKELAAADTESADADQRDDDDDDREEDEAENAEASTAV